MLGTAGEIIGATLCDFGVTCLFGMEDPIHIIHALDRDVTRIVTVRDEKHAAIIAHGYAQATGRPGVCAAPFGPGAPHLITGLLQAQRAAVAIIAIVQDHGLASKNRNDSSELDHAKVLSPFVKEVIRIDLPEQAGDLTRKAFRIATTGRPGPVVLLCPIDVMAMVTDSEVYAAPSYAHCPAHRTGLYVAFLRPASGCLRCFHVSPRRAARIVLGETLSSFAQCPAALRQ